MNKNLLIFGVAFLLVCVGLSGCEEQTEDSDSDEESEGFVDEGARNGCYRSNCIGCQ